MAVCLSSVTKPTKMRVMLFIERNHGFNPVAGNNYPNSTATKGWIHPSWARRPQHLTFCKTSSRLVWTALERIFPRVEKVIALDVYGSLCFNLKKTIWRCLPVHTVITLYLTLPSHHRQSHEINTCWLCGGWQAHAALTHLTVDWLSSFLSYGVYLTA